MSMNGEKLNKRILAIEEILKDDELADGITAISASFSHVIAVAIRSGNFDRDKLHVFMSRVEESIRSESGAYQQRASGIKRMD